MRITQEVRIDDMCIYYIISVVKHYMFRPDFVAIFRKVFLRKVCYKDNQTGVLI